MPRAVRKRINAVFRPARRFRQSATPSTDFVY
jgi:hypothetical protein